MKKCFICQNLLTKVFDLGYIYNSTFIDKNSHAIEKSPLFLSQCPNCHLVQLEEIIDLDISYRQYWYRSGLNPSMVESLKDIVKNIQEKINLADNDTVIDIGCNDGTLLSLYENKRLNKIGYDPALNLKPYAEKVCNQFVNDYYQKCVIDGKMVKAKAITAIAMFYDVPKPHEFLENIKQNLSEDGVFVIQMTDLLSMLKVNAFDNLCFEHIAVYSLEVLNNLVKEHGLEIFDVEYNDVNGGSLRTYIGFKNKHEVNKSVQESLDEENLFLSKPENSWVNFKAKIDNYRDIVVNFIKTQIAAGKKVFGMGASTKGNTLLQYFGIDNTLLPCISEVNSDKFGLYTVGTNIEIISEQKALEMKPDFFIALPWHFRSFLIKKSQQFLDNGGGLIFPLPIPELVLKNKTIKL